MAGLRTSRRGLCSLLALAVLGCGLSFVAPPRNSLSTRIPSRASVATQALPSSEGGVQNEEGSQVTSAWLKGLAAVCLGLVVAFAPLQSAEAARSGGRMGGSSMRARPPPQRSARPSPQRSSGMGATAGPSFSSGPRMSIGVAPMISPFGGFGLSPFGGFGLSPFGGYGLFGSPVLPLPIPVPRGPSMSDQMIQNQQVRDERQLESQKAEIAVLEKEIQELKAQKQ